MEDAGQYTENLTLDMVNAFLAAGGKDNEDFHLGLRMMKEQLHLLLTCIAFLTPAEQAAKVAHAHLSYHDVCKCWENRVPGGTNIEDKIWERESHTSEELWAGAPPTL